MFSPFISWFLFIVLSSLIPEAACSQEFDTLHHPEFRQAFFVKEESHYLNVSIAGRYTVIKIFDCTFKCLNNPSCFSLNLAASKGADGKLWCELLSSEKYSNPEEYKGNKSSHHFSIKTPCMSSPCKNGGTCVANYKYHTFDCRCRAGFVGEFCEIAEIDINECASDPCKNGATCVDLVGSYRCNCADGYIGSKCETAAKSCHDLYAINKLNVRQVVTLIFDSKPTSLLCQVGDFGCGDGGWTPVMKMDGNKQTFHYDSTLWNNNETFNVAGGETGSDTEETKLPSYWSTPFFKICLGMKIGRRIKFAVITKQADSLYSLIADGQYRATSLGRNKWKALIGSEASLQTNCNKEGFNAVSDYAKARIGFLGNYEGNCFSCESRIGFGTGGMFDDTNTCGNEATGNGDKGDQHIKGMGYILVQ